ncbi:MAG: toll/interleukin-1 receptor domain-containing protein [Planctomycetaceae bacterium]|nr:toll/interleukin-1 receptor domain-containing protein [Planctomycetaceae bacterium]
MVPYWPGKSPEPEDGQGKRYDVFMSYKSQDSDLVRAVAEWLMAAGLRVWFAEYQVLLRERDLFQRAIDIGIAMSQWGIAFTNPTYITSEHCQNELKALASSTGGDPEHLLEIVLGDAPLAKEFLSECRLPWVTEPHLFTGLPTLFEWLRTQLGITSRESISAAPPSGTNGYRGMADSYSMDLSRWEQISDERGWQSNSVFDGPAFRLVSQNAMEGKLTISSVRGIDRKSMQYGTEVAFQRNYFNALIGFAQSEFASTKRTCIGVHLVHKDDQVHFSTTSWNGDRWQRDYFIESPDAYGNGLEFSLQFRMDGTFQDFCRCLPATDALAQSLWFDSTLRYATVIDLQARESVSDQKFRFTLAPPIGWRRTGLSVSSSICDIDFRPYSSGLLARLWNLFFGRRSETSRQKIRRDSYTAKDLLNLQVYPLPSGFGIEQLEQRVMRTIAKNGGVLTFHLNGNRHGVRTYECLYHWKRRGHVEYGFQVHFILVHQIFSLQINSLTEISKGDERLILASAFADGIRVPDLDVGHEPERKREAERIDDGESAAASHYRAVQMTVRLPKCRLTLVAAEVEGPNVHLTYHWSEDLSHEQADNLDTCMRAFINSRIGDVAMHSDIPVRLNWGTESLKGVPIPLWQLGHRDQATFVVNSQFDVNEKLITLTVGSRFVQLQFNDGSHDQVSIGLYKGFLSLLTEIEICPSP